MSSYRVVEGDTLDSISRKIYGTEDFSDIILQSNPGVRGITVGQDLIVPDVPPKLELEPLSFPAGSPYEVSVEVDGRRFRWWSSISIDLRFSKIDEFSLAANFEPDNLQFVEAFRPFAFNPTIVQIAGQPLFSGSLIGVEPVLGPESRAIQVSSYASCGVLQEANASIGSYPLEWFGWDLRMIAGALCGPFGVRPEFTDGPGAPFEQVALKEDKPVLPFLIKLAKQRGFVVSSTRTGNLLFQKGLGAGEAAPVESLSSGSPPLVGVTVNFNHDEWFSHVTVTGPSSFFSQGENYTVRNPYSKGLLRPKTINGEDLVGAEVKLAAEAALGRMLADSVEVSVDLSTWFTRRGVLFEPNQIIRLRAPDVMIYDWYDFLIKEVKLSRTGAEDTCTLVLTIPGAFGGDLPETIPWA